MCGPWEGVIGMKKESALERFLTGRPAPYEVASGEAVLQGAIVDIDEGTGQARSIVRVRERLAG